MENLVQKLQNEAGLTEEQAINSLKVIKNFMEEEGLQIDWDAFVEGKYDDAKEDAKSLINKLADKTKEYADKLSDKVEDLGTEAKRKVRDLSDKADDFLDDLKK